MPANIPQAPPPNPLPPRPARVMTGKLAPQNTSRVYQGTFPWETDGDVTIIESSLPEGAATDATLQEMSGEIRSLQVLESIDERLKMIEFYLKSIAGA